MNVYRILKNTRAEGPGNRFSMWLQGCSRHCDGCLAKDTWSHELRNMISVEKLADEIKNSKDIEGITVLGGEPFEQALELEILLHSIPRKLSRIIFTGYTLDYLQKLHDSSVDNILQLTDVLVDGPYIKEKRSFSRPMVGSDNQTFHFFTDRYTITDFPPNRIELRIGKNGRLLLNGMGEIEEMIKGVNNE